jgi:D-alanyl-D-alanine carboxypeptidase/D-alanyl-D-alanine carboxypeptidase (penicillin-binding protein 5/6)
VPDEYFQNKEKHGKESVRNAFADYMEDAMQKKVLLVFLATVLILTCSIGVCFADNENTAPGFAGVSTAVPGPGQGEQNTAAGGVGQGSENAGSGTQDPGPGNIGPGTQDPVPANTAPGTGEAGQGDEITGRGAASTVPAPEISAPSALLMEAETGQILYEKNINAPLHISAANKLMTILVAIENGNLSSNVTASSESVNTEGSMLNLVVGEKYLMGDLLYAIMLTSANDATIAVAEHVSSGDIGKFVDLMNKTAEKLGMTDTYFTNPTGLYDENQYTTARDIALLVRYAIANPQFNTLFTSKVRLWSDSKTSRLLTSPFDLFWEYDGILGGKTGYNTKEKQTVISTASRSNLRLISIVLDAPEAAMFEDTKALLDYGFENFRKSTLVSRNEVIKTVEFEGHEVRLISQSDIIYVHPLGESYIKDFEASIDLRSPLKRTTPVGSAVYILNDGTEIRISLYPESEIVPAEDMKTRIQKLITDNRDIFIIVAVLVVIEILLLIANIGKLIARLIAFLQRRDRKRS